MYCKLLFVTFLIRNTSKKYNIMAFNGGDRVNCSTWTQVRIKFALTAAKRESGKNNSPVFHLRLVWKET